MRGAEAKRAKFDVENAVIHEVMVETGCKMRKVRKAWHDATYKHANKNPHLVKDIPDAERIARAWAKHMRNEVNKDEEEIERKMQPKNGKAAVADEDVDDQGGPSEYWVYDTGSGNFLIGRGDLTEIEARHTYIAEEVFQLATANLHLPTSNNQLPTCKSQLPTSNFQLPTSICQLPIWSSEP